MIQNLRTQEEITQNWEGKIDEPVVSISCLTYNHENYIRDALEGFLIQETNFPFKIFILDDASTDSNVEIIKGYENKYPQLFDCFLLKENTWGKPDRLKIAKPYLDARNRGKYIAMCEGDDYWTDPYKLQKQVDFLEANPEYGLVHTAYDVLYEQENKYIANIHEAKGLQIPEGYILSELLKLNFIGTNTVCAKTVALKEASNFIHANNKLKDLIMDKSLWLEISRKWEIGYIMDSTGVRRRYENSMSNSTNPDKRLRFFLKSNRIAYYYALNYADKNKFKIVIQLLIEKYKVYLKYLYKKFITRQFL